MTSIAVERDSRTFKMAASIARLGYESIVIEGEPSRTLSNGLPFRLLSPQGNEPDPEARATNNARAAPEAAQEPLVRMGRRLPAPAASLLSSIWRPIRLIVIGRVWGTIRYRIWPVLRDPVYILGWNLRDLIRRNRETGELLPEADVYWLHSFPQFPSVYRKARRHHAQLLYDTPDAYWELGQSPASSQAQRLVLRSWEALEASATRRADCFTSVSDGVAGLLERRFSRRPLVIRNSHDLRLDQPCDQDVRSVAGLGAEHFLLVMTGNLKPGMAVREALLALRGLPDRVHLALVGRNQDQSAGLVAELGLTDRAHLLGPVPPTQVVEFIRTADASPILYRPVTTNYLYALPNGFFHAIGAGLPILYPPLPEIRGIATEHRLGLGIDPEDPDSIVQAVSRLVEDPEATARYRANVERAREELSWEREEQLIAEILAAGPDRPKPARSSGSTR